MPFHSSNPLLKVAQQGVSTAESDMASLARQLNTIATGLESLPEYLRTLADQVRQDPAVAPASLTTNLHQLTSITQRLGALCTTIANVQVIRVPLIIEICRGRSRR